MFEYLTGKVVSLTASHLVLDVHGVGYLIQMANPYRLSDRLDHEVQIYVHQDVRQDAVVLFGFRTKLEKEIFMKLIKVSGIGPKSAMTILAGEDHQGLVYAIENDDTDYLMSFPGVGKKTAGQMVLDLKGKLGELVFPEDKDHPVQKTSKELAETQEALVALGYSQREIKSVMKELQDLEPMRTDEYLSHSLRLLTHK